MEFQSKVAIVTGGASGIGYAIALRFVDQGASVVVADIELATARGAVAELASRATAVEVDPRPTATAQYVDVASEPSVRELIAEVGQKFGRLNYLVNCAGIDQPTSLDALDEAVYDRIMGVDLKGAYLMSRTASPLLSRTGDSAIVNISSVMAWYTHPSYVAYTSAKAGVIGMTRALAVAMGPNVRVNAVCPGYIDTPIWQRNLDAMEHGDADAYAERIRAMHPVGRRGRPEDVAAAVTFLCSRDAAFLTGTHLVVDGGVTVRLSSNL